MTTVAQDSKLENRRKADVKRERSRSLSLLVWEGAHANVFIVMTGGAFLTGMAILFGANDFELGLLAAVPFALQSAQMLSIYLFNDPTKNRIRVARTLAVGRLLWLAVIPLLFLSGTWRLYFLIGLEALSSFLIMISSPAWLSWMAEVVPQRIRGRFFSRRNAAVSGTTVGGIIIGSLILDWSRMHNQEAMGFVAILLMAALGGLLAWRAMIRIPDIHSDVKVVKAETIDTLAPFRDRSFLKVLVIFAVWNIAIGLSAAFFAPHMLLNLKMSFFEIGLYSCATAFVAVVSSRFWGSFIDRFGSKPILNLCAFGICLVPTIWLFPRENSLWILVPEAIYSGLLWAGFNLAAFTLPLDRSPKIHRTAYLAVFAALTGLAFFLASILSGFVAESLAGWSHTIAGVTLVNYHILFLVSALVRLVAASLMATLHEPAEIRLPVVIQLMGYAVLKRMSTGRQLFPFAADAAELDEKQSNK